MLYSRSPAASRVCGPSKTPGDALTWSRVDIALKLMLDLADSAA
jgi:hypothetical protein